MPCREILSVDDDACGSTGLSRIQRPARIHHTDVQSPRVPIRTAVFAAGILLMAPSALALPLPPEVIDGWGTVWGHTIGCREIRVYSHGPWPQAWDVSETCWALGQRTGAADLILPEADAITTSFQSDAVFGDRVTAHIVGLGVDTRFTLHFPAGASSYQTAEIAPITGAGTLLVEIEDDGVVVMSKTYTKLTE